eukprot:m.39978 g.39978  ORF g.39978 m.39978 type:complete len:595 (+) comp12720_c0_seq4:17-1801(+)
MAMSHLLLVIAVASHAALGVPTCNTGSFDSCPLTSDGCVNRTVSLQFCSQAFENKPLNLPTMKLRQPLDAEHWHYNVYTLQAVRFYHCLLHYSLSEPSLLDADFLGWATKHTVYQAQQRGHSHAKARFAMMQGDSFAATSFGPSIFSNNFFDAFSSENFPSVHVDPVKVVPVHVDPVHVDPLSTLSPVHVDPVHVDPVHVDPVHVDPVHVDPVKVDPINFDFSNDGGFRRRRGGSIGVDGQLSTKHTCIEFEGTTFRVGLATSLLDYLRNKFGISSCTCSYLFDNVEKRIFTAPDKVAAVKTFVRELLECYKGAMVEALTDLVAGALSVTKKYLDVLTGGFKLTVDCGELAWDYLHDDSNSFQLGKEVGNCGIAVINEIIKGVEVAINPARRRAVGNSTLPADWHCLPQLYHDGLRCQVHCGAWDPDCHNASLPVVVPTLDTAPPAGWLCPPFYYNASDGCDAHCGVVDPDCESSCTDTFAWQPAATFTYAADKLAAVHVRNHSLYQHPELSVEAAPTFRLQPGSPEQSGSQTSSSSRSSAGALVGGLVGGVVGMLLLATLVVALIQRRRERSETHAPDTLSASLLAHVEQEAV